MADFDCFCQFTGHTVDFTIQWLTLWPIQNGVTMIITYFWKESIGILDKYPASKLILSLCE